MDTVLVQSHYGTETIIDGGETVKGNDFNNYISGCLFLNETNHISQLWVESDLYVEDCCNLHDKVELLSYASISRENTNKMVL